jgi:hypothetical protein
MQDGTLRVLDIAGATRLTMPLHAGFATVDVQHLEPGIYAIEFFGDDRVMLHAKFIKQ